MDSQMKEKRRREDEKLPFNQYFTDPTAATIERNYSGLLPLTGTFILDCLYVLSALMSATI